MRTLVVDGITVNTEDENMTSEEISHYIKMVKENNPDKHLESIDITVDGDYVNVQSNFNQPFERIRRITGYLVGTLDRFNNAKRAEERDRVKHTEN